MKVRIWERQWARAMLGYYKLSALRFSASCKGWCFPLHPAGGIDEKFLFFEQLLKFACSINTGSP